MQDCIFCKLIDKKIPSYIVYEDSGTVAFLDIFPATDGHIVVIPKRHAETIQSYSKNEIADVFLTVQKISAAVEKVFDTKILSIGINHGEPAGVHHLHVHIIPRYEGDGGGIIQTLAGRKPTEKDLHKTAAKIKGVL